MVTGNRTYVIPHPSGEEVEPLTRVSEYLGQWPKRSLEMWRLKTVATAIATDTGLRALALDASTCYQAVKSALDRGDQAANLGTAIHVLAEKVDAGELVPADADDLVADFLDGYSRTAASIGFTIVESEAVGYNFAHGYAGTLDRIIDLPGYGLMIADLKSGKNLYPDMALQLAAYANFEGLWDGFVHRPMPPVRKDLAAILHVRPEGTAFVLADLT